MAKKKNTELVPTGMALTAEQPPNAKDFLVMVMFPRIRSPYFPMAASIASGASSFQEIFDVGGSFLIAGFKDDQADLGRAVALLDHVSLLSIAQIFFRGELVVTSNKINTTRETLRCYLESKKSSDWRAHCFEVVDKPKGMIGSAMSFQINVVDSANDAEALEREAMKGYMISPCRLAWRGRRINAQHPSTIEEQLYASAVIQGCADCPNFDVKNYTPTEKKYW